MVPKTLAITVALIIFYGQIAHLACKKVRQAGAYADDSGTGHVT